MRKALTFSIVLSWFAATAAAAELPYREIRALWDFSELDFESLYEVGSSWAILRIAPAPDSGVSVGMYVDGKTGRLVREPGAELGVLIKGTLHQILRVDGKVSAQDPESYSWVAPIMTRTTDVRGMLYSPFRSGGLILSQYWGASHREVLFDPYYILPDDAARIFSSYFELRRVRGGRLMKIQDNEGLLRALREVAGENPIVALLAFRTLRSVDEPNKGVGNHKPTGPSGLIGTAQLKNRALLITDLLRKTQSFPPTDELKKLVERAARIEELRPIAAAARCVLDFGTFAPDDAPKKVSREILNQCSGALDKLDGDEKLRDEIRRLINR